MSGRKDWIERDEKDFVHRSKEARSGWDRGGKSMTDYLLEAHEIPVGKEFEVRKAYQLCNDRAQILSDKPARVIFSDDEETGHTDGKRVFVSTKVIDDNKTFVEKSDILLGITTHEMAHVMHTDFEPLKKLDRFTHTVWNIIEDERIEHMIGEEFPGYSGNIAAVKKYFFKEKYKLDKEHNEQLEREMIAKAVAAQIKAEDDARKAGLPVPAPPPPPEPLSKEDKEKLEVFDLFFKFVRFPEDIDADKVAEHEVMIDELKRTLTPYPTKSKEVLEAAKSVAETLRKSWDDIDPPSSSPSGGASSVGGVPSKGHAVESIITEAMTFAISENDTSVSKERMTADDISKMDYAEAIIDDTLNEAIFRNAIPNESKYKKLKALIKADAQLLARSLYVRMFNESKKIQGLRSGTLDDNRIVEAIHGVKTVHVRKVDKVEKKLNMVLLIDESGSMGRGEGSKSEDAAKVAILLEQCYKVLPMGQLFIYGFTSDVDEDEPYFNRIIRYKEPGFEIKAGLGDVQGRCNNRDGMCIRAVVNRVRQFSNEPMLFFVISDGQPAASGSYGGSGGIKDTALAVKEAGTKRFFPIQIGIGVNPDVQKMMFQDFVTYRDSRTMVEDLRKLLLNKAHKFVGI